jgi:hypothetical protein
MSNLALVHDVESFYTKTCVDCGKSFALKCFHKNAQQTDGYSCYCKGCTKERNKVKYSKSSENHIWKLKQTLKASKERAGRKNLEHTLTLEQLIDLYPVDGKCPIFDIDLQWGFPKDSSPSLDRIDSAKGYTYENCQIISNKANRLKSDATPEELELLVNYLKENHFV